MDDWNIDDFNFDNPMDGEWNRQAEMEVCFKTYDGISCFTNTLSLSLP